MIIVAAVLLGIANSSQAMEAGPIDISQKKEQSEAVTVFTPIITGLEDAEVEFNLNQLLANDVQRSLDKFLLGWNELPAVAQQATPKSKFYADYSVKFNRNGLLSITIQQSYALKGRSGKIIEAYTVNVNTGKVYNLFQLFRPLVDYNSKLSEIINKEIGLRHVKYSIKKLKDTQSFYLTEEGLVIYFQPYEISPKQGNVVRFVIPYEMIRDMLSSELAV
jgi:hypothetical protein